ncbi:hypothetical protein [Pseudorhodoferax soli]|uniref:CCHC-type domain-containing protein n=1 Tax=Pseudorhodoferax soli TaxID=545864 RepID=A0A368XNB7_9BURK|nr:hypothetical protein [Pseudorhodoferax soli]RCW67997.1 hypothetical protein DES41_108174 [Pseudorhodoferax soli]
MHCIACGREGHNSARCPLQLWKREAPAPVPAAPPAVQRAGRPERPVCRLDSHDRSREAWLDPR